MSTAPTAMANLVHPHIPDRHARLPLHAEVYLLAHTETGRPHINEQSLSVGLAGAVLLEQWIAGRVVIGWTYRHVTGQWQHSAGNLATIERDIPGDPLSAAAMATIRATRHTRRREQHLRVWLRAFAAADLYQRVRATMIAAGVLQHTSRRRWLGTTEGYVPVHYAWAVRAREQLRTAVYGVQHPTPERAAVPDDQCAALCGLIHVLELTPFLHLDAPRRFHHRLGQIGSTYNPTISQVMTAVDAGRGDLAVTAMG